MAETAPDVPGRDWSNSDSDSRAGLVTREYWTGLDWIVEPNPAGLVLVAAVPGAAVEPIENRPA